MRRTAAGLSTGVAVAVGLSLAVTVTAWLLPEVVGVSLLLPAGRNVVVWTERGGGLAAVGLLVWLLACGFAVRGRRREPGSLDAILEPFALLPLSLLGFLARPLVPQGVAATLFFYIPVLLASAALFRWVAAADARRPEAGLPARGALVVGVGFWIFYALIGLHFTETIGAASGDSGHYLVIADSLYHDHDVDLRNNLPGAERKTYYWHISPLTRGGHLYSWHPIGLPLLLAPFVPGGAPVRHLILGLLSGLGCAGIWELCRLFGARLPWALAALMLYGLSSFWGVHSSRSLPEVAGAALALWGVVAILWQRERPWGSALLCLATCAYLPWVHLRFLPVSAGIVGLYLLAGLAQRDSWPATLRRLGALGAAYAVAAAGYYAFQASLYTGGTAFPPGRYFFVYPPGMWYVLAHGTGLVASLPLIAAMIGAAVWIVLLDPPNRAKGAMVLALVAVVLVTSCAHHNFNGAASHPGRYFLVASPLLIPCLARALGRTNPVARWWALFLGLISCFMFLLMVVNLEGFRTVVDPWGAASAAFDQLNGLMKFFVRGDAAGILLFGGTFLLLCLGPSRVSLAWLLPPVMMAGAVASGHFLFHGKQVAQREKVTAQRLAALGPRLDRAAVQAWGELSPLDLFAAGNLFPGTAARSVIARDLARGASNDWAGRGHHWGDVVTPFKAGAGSRVCRLTGKLEGSAAAFWAVREGSRTLLEERLPVLPGGTVDVTAKIRCEGKRDLYVVVRFEGADDVLRDAKLSWSPFSTALLERGGFRL
jgi:hypothetical protein